MVRFLRQSLSSFQGAESRCVFKIGGSRRRAGLPDSIAELVRRLGTSEPLQSGVRLAAVSVIMSEKEAPSVLLMRRAEHTGDPWSGQIAFPGGKMQFGDASARDTAVRETAEEVGIDLAVAGEFLGYGPLMLTHTGTMQVVPVVFLLKGPADVRLNAEATSYRWASLEELRREGARTTHQITFGDGFVEMPAYSVGDYVVWGLTYRILNGLMDGAPDEPASIPR